MGGGRVRGSASPDCIPGRASLMSNRSTLLPRLHVLTDDRVLAREDFAERALALIRRAPALDAPRWTLHLRGPCTAGTRLFAVAEELVDAGCRAMLTVNDRVDVTLALDLPRVHLGQRSMSAADARRIAGDDIQIGVSVHTGAEADRARSDGADYLMLGHVFATPSHDSPPVGLGLVVEAAGVAPPVIAVGGISPARVGVLLRAGAHGVAILRGVWDAPDPALALGSYLERLPNPHHDVEH